MPGVKLGLCCCEEGPPPGEECGGCTDTDLAGSTMTVVIADLVDGNPDFGQCPCGTFFNGTWVLDFAGGSTVAIEPFCLWNYELPQNLCGWAWLWASTVIVPNSNLRYVRVGFTTDIQGNPDLTNPYWEYEEVANSNPFDCRTLLQGFTVPINPIWGGNPGAGSGACGFSPSTTATITLN